MPAVSPFRVLTRHFAAGLFDFGHLSGARPASPSGTMAGLAAAVVAGGIMLSRVFVNKYRGLHYWPTPDRYEAALPADHAFLIALPMWLVAAVTVVLGASLFPDERDYRILTPLPIHRRLIFAARISALVLTIGALATVAQLAVLPTVVITLSGRWADPHMAPQLAAYFAGGVAATLGGGLATAAVQGLVLLAVPRARVAAWSAAARSGLLFLLILSCPFVSRLPSLTREFSDLPPWLMAIPPAWFLGVERWTLGDARFGPLAVTGLATVGVAALVVAGVYLHLYRKFDRVLMRPATGQPSSAPDVVRIRSHRHPVFIAVRDFAFRTLARTSLPQAVVVTITGVACALVALWIDWTELVTIARSGATASRALGATVVWAPFVLILGTSYAVRAALGIPEELRANWVFRISERPESRAAGLDAAAGVARLLGVWLPLALTAPLLWLVFGPRAVFASGASLVWGLLLVELLFLEWRRLPFTCAYVFGKGFVPQMILLGWLGYLAFTRTGAALAMFAMTDPGTAAFIAGLPLIAAWRLRRARRRNTTVEPLEFEDTLPSDSTALRLTDG